MRRMTIPAIALAISLAPAALSAQTQPAPRGPRAEVRGPAVERIIAQREQLGLSQQQITELRRIQTQLEEKNRPLLEQLRTARENITPEQRAEMRQRMQQVTPEQRAQMQARRDSMRERMQHMTPEQREQMRERMRSLTPEQRAEMRPRAQRGNRPGMGPGMRGGVNAELQPVLEQIRTNTRAAAEQVHATLTAEQRQKLIELRPARRAPRGR